MALFRAMDASGKGQKEKMAEADHPSALNWIFEKLPAFSGGVGFGAIGHRVVHGGPLYRMPQRIDSAMIEGLRGIIAFDPEHLPVEISLMEICAEKFPDIPQVACFDTAFHATMPRVATQLPIPRCYEADGIQRYGFHGLSYAYLLQELERTMGPGVANGRVILAHLGNGASLAALREGRCIDTTMGLTPASGLMMGTRSGDVDPGLMTFLGRTRKMSPGQVDHMMNHESGLLGVSETSPDMRDLIAREKKDVRAAEAVELFCYQTKKWLGAYAAVLGGLDTLVFSGGIGENSPSVRSRICEHLGFLGISLYSSRNADNAFLISTDDSQVAVYVIATDEESMIARSVGRLLADNSGWKNKP